MGSSWIVIEYIFLSLFQALWKCVLHSCSNITSCLILIFLFPVTYILENNCLILFLSFFILYEEKKSFWFQHQYVFIGHCKFTYKVWEYSMPQSKASLKYVVTMLTMWLPFGRIVKKHFQQHYVWGVHWKPSGACHEVVVRFEWYRFSSNHVSSFC